MELEQAANQMSYAMRYAQARAIRNNLQQKLVFTDNFREYSLQQEPLKQEGIDVRVVNMRFGVVLSRHGGALAKMWVPFQMGLGGVLGSGKQMMSWVALDEIPFIIEHLINRDIFGPVNVVSPKPVSNKEFTKALGRVIKRPTFFPMPGFMIKLIFGEMGERLLLEGARVIPRRLQENGYRFHYPEIKSALEQAVK